MHRRIVFLLLILLVTFNAKAQKGKKNTNNENKNLTAEEIQAYKEQCNYLVKFLEGSLNFLGDPNQVISEKEIIINESYLKIFKDKNVQIEDDLDANRQVPLRKDVQAYLKDIVFFFKQVEFSFEIKNIELFTTENQEPGFKITFNRHIKGIMVNNDSIDNNITRYMEINVDPFEKDMKIVSIYTTVPNKKEEMRYWWSTLPKEWKDFFGSNVVVFDTLPFNKIVSYNDSTIVITKEKETFNTDANNNLTDLQNKQYQTAIYDTLTAKTATLDYYLKSVFHLNKLDISYNTKITSLEPVSQLTHLETLNCSHTGVNNIVPLRNLSSLRELNISHNTIKSIKPLRFCFALEELNLSNTSIDSINTLANLTSIEKLIMDSTDISNINPIKSLKKLKYLSMAYTSVSNLKPIAQLPALKQLILKGSAVNNLAPLATLPALEYINIDNTKVNDLSPLAKIPSLTTIQANNTGVKNLDKLDTNQNIKLIYCDNTGINREEALEFMKKNPESLVVFDSQRLRSWWNKLSDNWKKIFIKDFNTNNTITKEQLHKIVNIKEISLAGNTSVKTLEPLKMLFRLEKLDISNTKITNLASLSSLTNLRYLNINGTPVSSLESLKNLTALREVKADTTKISDILPLKNNKSLKILYCDNTNVEKANVINFKKYVPGCLVIYQTESLSFWWNNMEQAWREELSKQIEIIKHPTREQLQKIVDMKEVKIKNNVHINTLEPLSYFNYLEKLTVNFTSVSDLTPISVLDSLKLLNLSNNPVTDITPISKLKNLEILILENTGIEDLSPIENLIHLKVLNVSGTKVRKLKPVSNLINLEKLIINNTNINKLNDIENLHNLKLIKCYNTKLKKKKIDAFKTVHPEIDIVFY